MWKKLFLGNALMVPVMLTACGIANNASVADTADLSNNSAIESPTVVYTLPETEGDEALTVILVLEDDTEIECAVDTLFQAGEYWYISLFSPPEFEEDEIFLYRYSVMDDGEPVLDNIEDDAEFNFVWRIYEALKSGFLEDNITVNF